MSSRVYKDLSFLPSPALFLPVPFLLRSSSRSLFYLSHSSSFPLLPAILSFLPFLQSLSPFLTSRPFSFSLLSLVKSSFHLFSPFPVELSSHSSLPFAFSLSPSLFSLIPASFLPPVPLFPLFRSSSLPPASFPPPHSCPFSFFLYFQTQLFFSLHITTSVLFFRSWLFSNCEISLLISFYFLLLNILFFFFLTSPPPFFLLL